MTKKQYDIFNYSSLAIVLILLVLILTKAVPVEWFVYIASFAIVLLVLRIFLRIHMTMQSRKNKKE